MQNSFINFALCKIMFKLSRTNDRRNINKNTMKTKKILSSFASGA